MIIAVNLPIWAVGGRKPEKNQGFNGIQSGLQLHIISLLTGRYELD